MPDRGTVKRTQVSAVGPAALRSARRHPRRLPGGGLERAGRVGARVRVGHPDRGVRTADRLLRPAAPPRRRRPRARHRRPRRDVRRHQPLRAARARARLRVERHVGGPGHHRHVRRAAVRAGRLEADDRLDALPLPRPVPADRRPREDQRLDAERGRRHGARLGDAPRRADQPRPRDGTRVRARQAGGLHEAALDLLPRGRLGARVRGAERPVPDQGAKGLPARRLEDRLHLQLVLRRPLAHRVLQLRQQPGEGAADELALPGELQLRMAGLEPGPVDRSLHEPGARTRRRSTSRSSPTGTTSRRGGTGPPTTTSRTARSTARSRSPTGSAGESTAPRRCRSPS